MNAEQDGDRHPQPGGRRPDHVGEGVVGVLQEVLIREKDHLMVEMGQRENLPVMMMGNITDTGRMVVKDSKTAVIVAVELVLSEMPNTFVDHHVPTVQQPLDLPKDLTLLRPLHLLLNDVAVFAQSPFSTTGCATAIGEQPVKGLIDPAAMDRLTVG